MSDLDPDLLRTFVAIADTGRFGAAADRVHRTQAAVSLQVRRLEDRAGAALFRRRGRLMELTEAGETLLGYARRILELNAAALAAVRRGPMAGEVRFGTVQDLAETLLPGALRRFSQAHPAVKVTVSVAGSAQLRAEVTRGAQDMAFVTSGPGDRRDGPRIEAPLIWIAGDGWRMPAGRPLPLAVIDAPCPFRNAALQALDDAGLPWEIAMTSPSLPGVLAAVRAGLGITLRTALSLAPGLSPPAAPLPGLDPDRVAFRLMAGEPLTPAAQALRAAVAEEARAGIRSLPMG
ncbi:LysR substrate-binding domain-containing protein [Thalassospiraceae bacterium LMO-SO8]|nr:LysR substrate-binding domain-containing protein [Alphaproteobacteria bacterium LMO-S08]WND77432.1 LysR substrate-binding domain-containing protein [Thalassospiraceae bacterium LMO-SO8]